MKIVSKEEGLEWVRGSFGCPSLDAVTANLQCVAYRLPIDTGAKTAIARAVASLVGTRLPGLFWITEWGVWPSSENMAVFDGYRKSLGEQRGVWDAPAHIFDEAEVLQIECLLDLALYFYWDSFLFDNGRFAFRTSHDEFVAVYSNDEETLRAFRDAFSRLEIERLR